MTLGPSVGGWLFELGGYITPYFVLGGIVFFSLVPILKILPEDKSSSEDEKPVSMLKLFKNPEYLALNF